MDRRFWFYNDWAYTHRHESKNLLEWLDVRNLGDKD